MNVVKQIGEDCWRDLLLSEMDPDAHLPKYPSNYREGENRENAVSCSSSTSRKIVGADTFLYILQRQHKTCHFFLGPNACLLALTGIILHYWILFFFIPTHDSFKRFSASKSF
ncbi:hypothetical protein CDAR_192581 [Caerostris darwini]|uniref:Uncharacterized protein n=1 Tax=Caerostris darwini TaxID=1538125 RepID=A0AAV4W6R5_9ARAC|nr:hypothetical protein CDAR_192581 [Caerostris darwini]